MATNNTTHNITRLSNATKRNTAIGNTKLIDAAFSVVVSCILLIVGLLSRLAALMLTIEMVFTTLLVKVNIGLIASNSRIPGAELDLALMAGFIAILLLGPGKIALDYLLGIERPLTRRSVSR